MRQITYKKTDNEIHNETSHYHDRPYNHHILDYDDYMRNSDYAYHYANSCNDARTYVYKEINEFEEYNNISVYYCIDQLLPLIDQYNDTPFNCFDAIEDLEHYSLVLNDKRKEIFGFMIRNTHLSHKCTNVYRDICSILSLVDLNLFG